MNSWSRRGRLASTALSIRPGTPFFAKRVDPAWKEERLPAFEAVLSRFPEVQAAVLAEARAASWQESVLVVGLWLAPEVRAFPLKVREVFDRVANALRGILPEGESALLPVHGETERLFAQVDEPVFVRDHRAFAARRRSFAASPMRAAINPFVTQ